jgi:hypothetical protein
MDLGLRSERGEGDVLVTREIPAREVAGPPGQRCSFELAMGGSEARVGTVGLTGIRVHSGRGFRSLF